MQYLSTYLKKYFPKYALSLILMAVCTLCFALSQGNTDNQNDASSKTTKKTKQVLIIQNVEHPALNASRQGILDELQSQNIEVDFDSAQGNPTLALQIAQKFVGSSPDVMVGIGTTSTQALVAADQKRRIPIVFCSVTDPMGAKLVNNLKHPEDNVTGVSNYIEPSISFNLFKQIIPNLSKIGIIYSPGEPNSVAVNEQMKKTAATMGLNLIFVPANSSVDVPQAARGLVAKKVQAIFINNDNVALSAFDSIVKIGNENMVPVFCSDTDMIEHGALAAIGPNQYDLGRQAGKMILKILSGEKENNMPVLFPEKTEVYLNLKQAKLNGITFSEAVLKTAAKVEK